LILGSSLENKSAARLAKYNMRYFDKRERQSMTFGMFLIYKLQYTLKPDLMVPGLTL
jgi:hypothetical protein